MTISAAAGCPLALASSTSPAIPYPLEPSPAPPTPALDPLRTSDCLAADFIVEQGPEGGGDRLGTVRRDHYRVAMDHARGTMCGHVSDTTGGWMRFESQGPETVVATAQGGGAWALSLPSASRLWLESPLSPLRLLLPVAPGGPDRGVRGGQLRGIPAEVRTQGAEDLSLEWTVAAADGRPLRLTWRGAGGLGIIDFAGHATGQRSFTRVVTDFRGRALDKGLLTAVTRDCAEVRARLSRCAETVPIATVPAAYKLGPTRPASLLAFRTVGPSISEAGWRELLAPGLLRPDTAPPADAAGSLPFRIWRDLLTAADGPRCPHFPTCSHYCLLAVRRRGLLKGMTATISRIMGEAEALERQGILRLVTVGGRWRIYDPVE